MMDTPIILKTDDATEWCKESMFYMVTADGLFLCRNHEFFTSSVKVKEFPAELASHKPFLKVRYPKIPAVMLETVAGFFRMMAKKYGEVAVLLVQHVETGKLELVVPEQECSQMSVDYEVPPLSPGWRLVGDIHSHVEMSAYASGTDKHDEEHRPGLHVVIGRVHKSPPEFHAEFVVDGMRFMVKDMAMIVDGEFKTPRQFPLEWKDKLTKKLWKSYIPFSGGGFGGGKWDGEGRSMYD